MHLRKFAYNKLCRDKLIDIIEKRGSKVHWRQLNDTEFDAELRRKIMEEAEEVAKAQTKAELIEELADVVEVIDAFCKLHQCSFDDIVAAQHKKREERGGFEGRVFISTAEHPAGSYSENYCLSNPLRYPEIIE